MQIAFYLAAANGLLLPATRRFRLVSIPMYFVLMNAAMVRGLFRHLFGGSKGTWNRTTRTLGRIKGAVDPLALPQEARLT